MTNDARFSVGFPTHPKTKKLRTRLGEAGCWGLACLILWAAQNRSDGDLSGMDAEDIELAADWRGESGLLVKTLQSLRFLDGEEGSFGLHDWTEHNPWASGAEMRSAKARWNAVKRFYGPAEADRQVPEYASVRATGNDASSNAASNASSKKKRASSNAPSPNPSPNPSLSKATPNGVESLDATPSTLKLVPPSAPPVDAQARICAVVIAAYHETLPKCRRIEVVTPKAKRKILAADKLAGAVCKQQSWDMPRREFWLAYFDECLDDPWLRGDLPNPNNSRWKQNLLVLIDDERFQQIMDQAIASAKAAA